MRRRKIQDIGLTLNDLKEYEAARQERLAARQALNVSSAGVSSGQASTSTTAAPMKPPPKTRTQEIHERIGL
ncbi:hypothetical protein DMENIID0001_014800 [Sergentomyia squamirostris]